MFYFGALLPIYSTPPLKIHPTAIQKQAFRGAQKDTSPTYFFKFQENVSRNVRHYLKGS